MTVTYFGPGVAAERWKFFKENRQPAISIDVETVSLDERKPLGIGVAFSPQEAFYFSFYPEVIEYELQQLIPILEDIRIVKIAHNWIFDMGVFPLIPVIGDKLNRANIFDTNVAARLRGYQYTSLPDLALEYNMKTTGMAEIMKDHSVKDNVALLDKDPIILAQHCADDTRATYRLWLEWKDWIRNHYGEYFKVEMEALPILTDLSMHGILIDQKALAELVERYTEETAGLMTHIQSFGITKPGSARQVGMVLAERGNFLPLSRNKKQLRADKKILGFLDDPLAGEILLYRTKSKFLSTYLTPLIGEDRFYTEYYTDTGVGRLNSRNRNIQNIPGENKDTGDPGARFMLVPDNGVFTTADYSREHLYILGNFSKDEELLSVLYNPDKKLADIHQHTADLMGVERKLAKVANFAVIYGATASTLMEQLHTKDKALCESLMEKWFRAYPGAALWIQEAQRYGMREGWSMPTVFGRSIKLPEESEDGMRRKAVNYPILGSDGEVIKRAFILCRNRGVGIPHMVISVHDSITWDGDLKDRIPVEELEYIPGFRVPIEVKQTLRWE